MKVILQLIVSRDGYIAGIGDDVSWISGKTREQYSRTICGMGNCIVGRRTSQVLKRQKIFDRSHNPFTVVLSKHNYPSQPNIHFTHAKPKNILKLLDEKGRSSTVICGGAQTAKVFVDAGVVDMVHIYNEDVDVEEGIKFSEKLLDGYICMYKKGLCTIYTNNDTSSHSG